MPPPPEILSINAWIGPTGKATGPLDAGAGKWSVRKQLPDFPQRLAAAEPPNLRDWADPAVGWGILLPENEEISKADRARAVDASPAIKKLLAARAGAPVFRYRSDSPPGFLRRYYSDGKERDIALSGSDRGNGLLQLPYYMLIVGPPTSIPWQVQYLMNISCFTGRLDLDENAMDRYVTCLVNNWKGAASNPARPVGWAVDHGQPDITWLMRRTISDPVAESLRNDTQIGVANVSWLAGAPATTAAFVKSVATAKPAFVLTTSHGLTFPLDDPTAMAAQLGFPVDDAGTAMTPTMLLDAWQPDGVIWYAHACCSAGSDRSTSYDGLVMPGSLVDDALKAVARVGATVAPLPKAMLSAAKPARAFIGQVEPTFDYTLRDPAHGQVLTATIRKALYDRMFRKQPETVGMAFEPCYRHVGELFAQWEQLVRQVAQAIPGARARALQVQLMGLDRQSMVILGDPTVALPPLP